jgi:hypothetical protein
VFEWDDIFSSASIDSLTRANVGTPLPICRDARARISYKPYRSSPGWTGSLIGFCSANSCVRNWVILQKWCTNCFFMHEKKPHLIFHITAEESIRKMLEIWMAFWWCWEWSIFNPCDEIGMNSSRSLLHSFSLDNQFAHYILQKVIYILTLKLSNPRLNRTAWIIRLVSIIFCVKISFGWNMETSLINSELILTSCEIALLFCQCLFSQIS